MPGKLIYPGDGLTGTAYYMLGRSQTRPLPPASRQNLVDYTPAKRPEILAVTEASAFSQGERTVALTRTDRLKLDFRPFGQPNIPVLVKPGYYNQTDPRAVGAAPAVIRIPNHNAG